MSYRYDVCHRDLSFLPREELTPVISTNTTSVPWNDRLVQDSFVDCASEKTQIISLRVLAGVLGAASLTLVGLTIGSVLSLPIGLGVGIPLLILGIISVGMSCSIYDYQDPQVIENFRKEAETMTLDQIVSKHGWKKVFEYGIPLPERFQVLYNEKMSKLDVERMIAFYETATNEYEQASHVEFEYTFLPPKHWKAKWKEETTGLSCVQIFQKYSIKQLRKYEILSEEEAGILDRLSGQYTQAQQIQRDECVKVQEAFHLATNHLRKDLDFAIELADRTYKSCLAHRYMHEIEEQFSNAKKAIEEQKHARIAQAEASFLRLQNTLTNNGEKNYSDLSEEQRAFVDRLKQELAETKQREESIAQQNHQAVYQEYLGKRRRYAEEIARADAERQRIVLVAQRRFDDATAPQRRERDGRLAVIQAAFAQRCEEINSEYNRFRRS
jgi:hypothetical protein